MRLLEPYHVSDGKRNRFRVHRVRRP
jgi:hypothetical protein